MERSILAFYSCFMRDLPSMCFPRPFGKALWISHSILLNAFY